MGLTLTFGSAFESLFWTDQHWVEMKIRRHSMRFRGARRGEHTGSRNWAARRSALVAGDGHV